MKATEAKGYAEQIIEQKARIDEAANDVLGLKQELSAFC